jgi:NAD(P)-dependent dehydrogenase (short-subunit alcohol dehydrogenase family)
MSTNDVVRGASVLVTGTNRGLGQALVEEALRRGAARVYAASRRPMAAHRDSRVTPVTLDVTDARQIKDVARSIPSLDVLVNNAGVGTYETEIDDARVQAHLAVNLVGPLNLTRALTPQLTATRGVVVNVSSIAAVAALPLMPAYSISKAAALSMTQSQRALLAGVGIRVHAVLAGPLDTDMSRDLPIEKAAPVDVARAIFDGVDLEQEEIFPDVLSASLAEAWRGGMVKMLEQENAGYVNGAVA